MQTSAPSWQAASLAVRRVSSAERATAVVLLGTVALLAATLLQGTLDLYINGVLRPLVLLSLAVLALQLVALLGRGRATVCEPGCQHAHPARGLGARQALGVVVLAAPILLGLLVPPQVLGTAAIAGQDIASAAPTASGAVQTAANFDMNQAYEPAGDEPDPLKRNVLQWRRLISGMRDPAATLGGQPVDLVGVVYHGPGDGADRFTLARYVIRCCVADAVPMGLAVRTPRAATLKPDTWVRISGVFAAAGGSGQPSLVIEPRSIEPVSQPSTPYINGLS
jgi:uncharacterized repeat protein (TIGR03943 family)